MKKVLAIAVASIFVLASCKKDYTCECTGTNGSSSITQPTTVNGTKSDAKAACEAKSTSASGSSVTCKIK